ncbi:Crp/Fnr family transcriptional regulator [Microvirga lotononidis]|uniref:cAMP-binding protein n=1 Tax=Microvirga lotononidis TaxID=864069 RepID=I4YKL5_9HYPH|nr:Crp/Fnr family transcriptional regulator [Microvirga lotononidis]EIM24507.1 cAMP-binding protein [Microvirga lotononidis]WQO26532.1 Crp/Fnr family transcriptional regulator [Microvirga lotononidis]
MKNGTKAAIHRRNQLLAALEPDDYLWLEPHLEVVELPRGKVVYQHGEQIRHTYFPHDAVISLVAVLQDGGSVEMAIFGREAVFGFISALGIHQSFGRYVTQVAGTTSRIALDRLRDAIDKRPNIRRLLFRYTEALLSQTLQSVACNAVHNVEARCCRAILSTRDRTDKEDIPLTHEILAEMLGVQRSTVSSVTSTLQRMGLISQGRGTIRITDHAGLEETACECYHAIRGNFARLLPASR